VSSSKIAHQYGISGWKVLWDHPKNEPLRKKRKSPHVLLPGDMVAVPGVKICEIVRTTDGTYRIEVKEGPQRRVRVRVQNLAGEPIEDLAYSYVLAGIGEKAKGCVPTDRSGRLEEVVPLEVHALELHFADFPQSVQVHPGVLDPLRDEDTKRAIPSGIQARLLALGYDAGPPGQGDGAIPRGRRNVPGHRHEQRRPDGSAGRQNCR
jgi:N-acetylmuramoyl-L-alanine amidase